MNEQLRIAASGFTLLELMVAVAVVGVTLAVGVPPMASLMRTNRIATETNDLVATLHLARNEAMKNVVRVTACKSNNGATCDTSLSWHDGWITFLDNDADGVRDGGGTPEVILAVRGALSESNTLASVAFADWIAFRPDGLVTGSAANSGRFTLCNEDGTAFGRRVNIARTGGVALEPAVGGDCP